MDYGFGTWLKLARWIAQIPMLAVILFLTVVGLISIFFDGD